MKRPVPVPARKLQERKIRRQFALSPSAARTIATLAWGGVE